MKRTNMLGALLSALVFLAVLLVPAAHAAEIKIGFINRAEVITNSDMGKRIGDELRKIMEKEISNLQRQESEITKMRTDLEKQRGVIKNDVFQERELDIQKRLREFQMKKSNVNDELQLKQQEKMQEIGKALDEVIQAIGKKEKYNLILDVYTLQPPYFDKDDDITERVTKELNKKR